MESEYKVYRGIGYQPCPCLPILASMIHPFKFLYTPKGFLSLQIARQVFSSLYVPPCVGKFFQFYGVHIPRKCIESMDFYSCSSSTIKTPG